MKQKREKEMGTFMLFYVMFALAKKHFEVGLYSYWDFLFHSLPAWARFIMRLYVMYINSIFFLLLFNLDVLYAIICELVLSVYLDKNLSLFPLMTIHSNSYNLFLQPRVNSNHGVRNFYISFFLFLFLFWSVSWLFQGEKLNCVYILRDLMCLWECVYVERRKKRRKKNVEIILFDIIARHL